MLNEVCMCVCGEGGGIFTPILFRYGLGACFLGSWRTQVKELNI